MLAQVTTLFIMKGATFNRNIGPHFKIPPASLSSFFISGSLVSVVIYDRYFVPIMLQKIGIGQALQIIIMIMAGPIEVVGDLVLLYQRMIDPLTVFVLLPQFALMKVTQILVEVGKNRIFL